LSSFNNRINIIILNYFGKNDTIECLESLNKSPISDTFRIILINNSAEEIFDKNLFKKFGFEVEYIQPEKNTGFCAGNNIGLKLSYTDNKCGYIMLLNNDTVLEPDAVAVLKNKCDKNPVSLINPILVFYDTKKIQCTGGYWNLFFGIAININKGKFPDEIKKEAHPYFLNGCCIFGKKEIFEKTGFLDETFFAYGEDIDFSMRAKKAGIELKVANGAVVYHKHSKSSNGYNKQYLICRNNYILVKKNFGKIYFFIFAPIHIFFQIVIGYFIFKNTNIKRMLKSVLLGYFDGIRNRKRTIT